MIRDAHPGEISFHSFSIGRVLKDTVRVMRTNPLGCAIISIAYIVLWHLSVLLTDHPSEGALSWWNFVVTELLAVAIDGFVGASLIYVGLLTLGGTRPSFADWTQGLRLAVPVAVVFFVCGLPSTIGRLMAFAEPGDISSGVLQIVIYLFGYALTALWLAAAPAIVAEGLGPLAALRRATTLTAGYRGRIFALLCIVGFAFWLAQVAIWYSGAALNAEMGHRGSNLIFWIGEYLLPATGLIVWSLVQTAGYATLRFAKESAGAQHLAQVFD